MNIKSFVASDMRTALRMIRDAQGPDAVILSSRPVAGGIEVVSATEYDQAALARAMRAAGADPADASPAALSALAQQQLPAGIPASVGIPAQPAAAAAPPIAAPPPPSAQPDPAAAFAAVMDKARPATHGADSLLARARARLLGQPAEPAPSAEPAQVHVAAPEAAAQVDVQDFAAALRARLAQSEAQATVTLDMTRPAQPITAAPVAEAAAPIIGLLTTSPSPRAS
ncbi:hypothetical protein [Pseudoxanthomonas winnipegensis]|uniref:hypothetical protein n=1 Tax=Pseudoxanthomonas winnipegensis TaxID=2480810 RepID=UPI001038F8B9|nr:hypothetical protein [Pseudoxanthomonas winnipegensis]TBV73099.1 hypothetical protein EYC45_13570 [Pseudoxanthomonas winnipegensis]